MDEDKNLQQNQKDEERVSAQTLYFRFMLAFLGYFFLSFGLAYLNINSIWIPALVLAVVYMLLTLSPKDVKKIWDKRIVPLMKDTDHEQR